MILKCLIIGHLFIEFINVELYHIQEDKKNMTPKYINFLTLQKTEIFFN